MSMLGWAVLLVAVAILVAVLFMAPKLKTLTAEIAGVKVQASTVVESLPVVAQQVSEINRAVNQVPQGTPPLVARVTRLERQMMANTEWERAAFRAIAEQIGAQLPEPPKSR